VDESETGSANFFGPALERDFLFSGVGQAARSARALLEKESPQIARMTVFGPLDRLRGHVSVLLAPSTERE
jgi:hypothetical protein